MCSCPLGMELGADNKTCQIQSFCAKHLKCSQKCEQEKSSVKCSCYKGWELESDMESCKSTDPFKPFIIFSNRHEIRRIELHKGEFSVLVPGLRNTIALDFHLNQSTLYWTDVVEDKIYRGKLSENGALTSFEVVIQYGLATPEGLAVDWIAGNIYWVESNLDQIEVAKLDGTMRTTLLAGKVEHPRAIALDPRDGILFWTDWDASLPRIEAASMSGEGRRTIHRETGSGGWPNGLTVDYMERRIVWIDARSDAIYSAMYDGSGLIEVLRGHEYLSHPFAVTMYGGEVYWTDWRTNTLAKANKWTGHNVTVVQRTNTQPFDLQVYHPSRQPQAPNPCATSGAKGLCSHLCLINFNQTFSCACPHLMKLQPDKRTCKESRKFLLYARQIEIRGVDIDNPYYNYIISFTVPDIDNVTVVDYDAVEHRIYWSDVRTQTIKRAFINGTGVETVVSADLPNAHGLAVDWVSRNLFWTSYDANKKQINVARLDGSFKNAVIQGLDKPHYLVVHPLLGKLYWTDGDNISMANMDGSNRTTLFTSQKGPVGLSIDYDKEQLYWISSGNGTINRCQLDGSKLEILEGVKGKLTKATALAIMGDKLWWADQATDQIGTCDKKDGGNWKVMRNSTSPMMHMRIYDEDVQKAGINLCSNNNGDCSQLCLPTSLTTRACMCTAGYSLKRGQQSCEGMGSFLLYSVHEGIRGIPLDPADKSDALVPVSGTSLAVGIDFHAENDTIYWVDMGLSTISRAKRDQTWREDVITNGIGRVEGITVDWIAAWNPSKAPEPPIADRNHHPPAPWSLALETVNHVSQSATDSALFLFPGPVLFLLPSLPVSPPSLHQADNQEGLTRQVAQLATSLAHLSATVTTAPSSASSSQHSPGNEPHIPDPEPFSGELDKCRGFVLQCHLVYSQQPRAYRSNRTRINYAINRLRGRALSSAESMNAQGRFIGATSAEFFHELQTVFDHSDYQGSAIRRLMALKQGSRSVKEYAVEFQMLAAEAGWNDQALRGAFWQGRQEHLKDILATRDEPATFAKLVAMAIKMDNRLRERRNERNSQTGRPRSGEHSLRAARVPGPGPEPQSGIGETSTSEEEPMQVGRTRLTPKEQAWRVRTGACLYCGGQDHYHSEWEQT
uniref:low-density lipoprotein receptor-related protein 1-like n=1 Tax=Monopterus albus TaxID=43700 RepID=UPI0009B391BC|nr:low-density lipoprotein receptor-related protein 1-like [Monopterus albus]